MWTLVPGGPDWMPITPKTGALFHADSQYEEGGVTGLVLKPPECPGRSVTP
jgi:hypothetical protein